MTCKFPTLSNFRMFSCIFTFVVVEVAQRELFHERLHILFSESPPGGRLS